MADTDEAGGGNRPLAARLSARLRISAVLERSVHHLADEVRTIPGGWAVRSRDLPQVWTLNQLHLGAPVTAEVAVALADEHQADLAYRYFVVDHEPSARRIGAALSARGWQWDRLLLMASDPGTSTAAGEGQGTPHRVIRLDEEHMAELLRRWLREAQPQISTGELEQVEEYHRREGRSWNERGFGALGRAGTPATMAKLRSDGTIAWVEDVYTVVEERRRGLARAVLSAVAAAAHSEGHELTFLLADDDDWPKRLYAQLGFAPVGRRWSFRRSAGEAAAPAGPA
jgi:GNAT superfamily N-acetyltransferase